MPASGQSHLTLTRGEGEVCLTIFVDVCLKSTKNLSRGFPNILSTENFHKNIRKIQKQKQIQIELTLYVNFMMKLYENTAEIHRKQPKTICNFQEEVTLAYLP